jgi:hypothetical protein
MNLFLLFSGQFPPAKGGQFHPASGGHFQPARGGQLVRRLQNMLFYHNIKIVHIISFHLLLMNN